MGDSTKQQEFDILDLGRPGIIEASAGTGKTYSIAEIYISLLCGHRLYAKNASAHFNPGLLASPPSVREILVVTFTRPATAELTDRLQKRIRQSLKKPLPPDASDVEKKERRLLQIADAEFDEAAISTIHGFCTRILRDFSFECGLPSALVPAENISDEAARFAARFYTREVLLGRNSRLRELSTEKIRRFLENGKITKHPDARIARPNDANGDEPLFYVATEGLKAWLCERRHAEQLSFDEVLLRLRDALRENPELAKKIASRYRVALVDEFQDTDPVQWEIFKCIFVNGNLPFFCVGDPKQAIYGFRGGDIRTYRQATGEILEKNPDNFLKLTTNWRSGAGMIRAFNDLFNADKSVRELGDVTVSENLNYSDAEPPEEKKNNGTLLPAAFLRTGFDGARAADAIREQLVRDIVTLVSVQNIPPDAIAVLVENNQEADKILKCLTSEGIPATKSATNSVLRSAEAESVLEILNAMLNPRDAPAVRRAATCEFFGSRFYEAIALCGDVGNEALAGLRETFFECQKIWKQRGILPAFSLLAKTYSFRENLAKLDMPARRLADMSHLVEILQSEAYARKLEPHALFKRFEEMRLSPNDESEYESIRIATDAPAVKVSTIHKSKGLQYEFVFLPFLWREGVAPDPRKKEICVFNVSDDGEQEILLETNPAKAKAEILERAKTQACVNYVAFTRAKNACFVYHPENDKDAPEKVSYFSELLKLAGILGNDKSCPESWKILTANEALPQIQLPENPKPVSRNLPPFLLPPDKSGKDAWGIFSFSKIIGSHEDAMPGELEPETDESGKSDDSRETACEIFHAPEYYDLAAGKEFGTLVHAIFEKLEFRTCGNLDSLINAYKNRFPQWLEPEESRKKFRKMFEAALELPVDGKSLKLNQIDVSRDALRELEFFFQAKQTKNLYSDLNDIFSSWGGIYEKTAQRHWSNGTAGTLEIEGLMHGYIDLAVRANGCYYIADWKTNRITAKNETTMSRKQLEDEIVECGYALQWAIYAVALRKYLRKTRSDERFSGLRFGGIAYFFVRWNTVFFDDTPDDAKLDAIENILTDEATR